MLVTERACNLARIHAYYKRRTIIVIIKIIMLLLSLFPSWFYLELDMLPVLRTTSKPIQN